MMFVSSVQSVIRNLDAVIARCYLAMFRERDALMCFMFHSLFRDEEEIARNFVDPLQRTTTSQLREFIEYYLKHDYTFVAPGDLLAGLERGGKFAMITFDDGYFNNTLARPILEQYQVPATFFISTDNVRDGKKYWWDVVYCELSRQGWKEQDIFAETLTYKHLKTDDIELRLRERFGDAAMRPRGDIDRPMTPAELREFASCPFVHLGNHTANHAILTNYPPEEMRRQVRDGQNWLAEQTGGSPIAIAYPNGGHDSTVIEVCREEGLKIGVTIQPAKNALPLDGHSEDQLMRLSRFCPHGEDLMLRQCRTYRSDFLIYGMFRNAYLKLARGSATH